jgi:hypothetical protein
MMTHCGKRRLQRYDAKQREAVLETRASVRVPEVLRRHGCRRARCNEWVAQAYEEQGSERWPLYRRYEVVEAVAWAKGIEPERAVVAVRPLANASRGYPYADGRIAAPELLQGSTWGLRWVVVALHMGGLASGDAKLLVISSPDSGEQPRKSHDSGAWSLRHKGLAGSE